MSKKSDKKTPLWMSIIQVGVLLVFSAYLFVPDDYFVAGLAVWALTFWVGVFGILLGCSLGYAAIVSRRKASKKNKADEATTSSVSA